MIAVIFEFTPAPGRFPDYAMDARAQAPSDSVAAHG
jgi:hypothetical protein